MNSPVIVAKNLTKQYGSLTAVDAASFTVQTGEIVGFVGANGAGKTTTISLLLGMIRATSGSVAVFSAEITTRSAHRSHHDIGYATGDMALFEQSTGREYLAFVAGQYKGDYEPRFQELVKQFEPQLDKKIKTLSRGNKQKIALIAAFMMSPRLIILDEPTSGLDPVMQEAFLELIREERAKGTTIFMSSHYLQEVVDVCTRVLLMKNGRITHDLHPNQLLHAGGRSVRLVSAKKPLKLPPKSTTGATAKDERGVLTTFTYSGEVADLLVWLSSQPGVLDVEITAHSLEGAFLDLYKEETI